jgi:glycosyltransferase involved in cell wall biosynthesis
MHLQALLAQLPDRIQPIVAVPDSPPDWLSSFSVHVHPGQNTPSGRLGWEQRILPQLDRKFNPDLLHLTSTHPPLLGPGNSVVSPAGFGEFETISISSGGKSNRTFKERVREALASGGLARARALIWPDDLPVPEISTPILQMPPTVHPGFFNKTHGAGERISGNGRTSQQEYHQAELPETFILYHGPGDPVSLSKLVEAWSWAAGSIGEYYPLLVLGLDDRAWRRLEKLLGGSDLAGTIRPAPALPSDHIHDLYAGCTALFHPAPVSPWGGPVRHALASGKPVVSIEGKRANAMVGPAAYLVPPGDSRALAAALITVVVEETVAENLAEQAIRRAARWQSPDFKHALVTIYEKLLGQTAG